MRGINQQDGRGGGVASLVSYFSDPEGKAPIRLPTYPALDRTSVLATSTPVAFAGTATPIQRLALFPQPALPLWADTSPYPISQFTIYTSRQTVNVTTGVPTMATGFVLTSATTGATAMSNLTPVVTGFSAVPSSFAVLGQDSGTGSVPFTYVPSQGCYAVVVNFNSSSVIPASGNKATINIEAWTSPGGVSGFGTVSVTFDGTNPSASVEIATPIPVWIRPVSVDIHASVSGNIVNVGIFATNVATGDLAWNAVPALWGTFSTSAVSAFRNYYPVITAGPVSSSPIPWNETRVTAAALTVNNVTPLMTRGGTLLASKLLAEDTPVTRVQSVLQADWDANDLQQSNPQDLYFGPAEATMTGFVLPPTADLGYQDCMVLVANPIAATSGLTQIPIFRLDDVRPFLAMAYGFSGDWTLAVRLTVHLEFRNAKNLFPLGISTVQPAQMMAAARQLASMRPFRMQGPASGVRPSAAPQMRWQQRFPRVAPAPRQPRQRLPRKQQQGKKRQQQVMERRQQPQQAPRQKLRGGLEMYLQKQQLKG